ncbi:MAG TPA: phage holin family protein [Candidatus Aquabacterium excrementipullorum]|nr:phage holin family protein [Candidatus Aquabacterium excrementipullorum]
MWASAQNLLATLVAIVQTRVELLATELEEEKRRLLSVMAWGAVAVLLACFGLVFLAVFVTVLFWDDRVLVAGVIAVLFLAAGGLAWWRVEQLLKASSGLLSASIGELDGDRQALAAAAARVTGQPPTTPAGGPHADR